MRVITIASTKGGVGKTTLASALAVRASTESPRVAMVDLCPIGSLAPWRWRRGKCSNPEIFTGGVRGSLAPGSPEAHEGRRVQPCTLLAAVTGGRH
jgi:Mrp family chromosome partitioning ATPase